jgi:pimeloyl-ACP methyl ester carboxylesterase
MGEHDEVAGGSRRRAREVGRAARLARWLGPWTRPSDAPSDVTRQEVRIEPCAAEDRPLAGFVYAPRDRAPQGALLLVPGLHYAGPRDLRMDRFARVLASSGLLVLAPSLPDFEALLPDRRVFGDAERALDALLAHPGRPRGRPAIFSISFGSLPALHLAGSRAADVGGTILFGGYADFEDTLRFCVRGRPGAAHDPLNRPVAFMNLLNHLPDRPDDPAPVLGACRRYIEATWGRPEMKADGRWRSVASSIAEELPREHRRLFALATGLEAGGEALVDEALARAGDHFDFLDPRPLLFRVRGPVHLVHGADDDVIPFEHAHRLAAALPRGAVGGVHVTGLYGHTHVTSPVGMLRDLPALGREIATMARVLRAIAEVDD